jgi:hypothetical protein
MKQAFVALLSLLTFQACSSAGRRTVELIAVPTPEPSAAPVRRLVLTGQDSTNPGSYVFDVTEGSSTKVDVAGLLQSGNTFSVTTYSVSCSNVSTASVDNPLLATAMHRQMFD